VLHALQVAAAAAAADAETAEGDDEARASVAAAAVKESYDYLLSMAIYSLTWEKVQVRIVLWCVCGVGVSWVGWVTEQCFQASAQV
jgi:hypothetical protein